ncbi:PQQ-binding-like beta-propeller repeat protein [Streptomyces sp. NPDC026665]|uniref:outer membrane protein assembly factor BamB family protein n=1 Tax=Streptomyces sp. NPDC026665 TaxID=3154798 RepID=UPI0034031F4F
MPSASRPRFSIAFLLAAVSISATTACSADSGPAHVASAPTASVAKPGPYGPRALASHPRELSNKPIAVGAGVVLTLPDDRSTLVAYDPATGAERWKSSVQSGYAEQAWPVGDDFIVSWGKLSPDGTDQSVVGEFVARLDGRTGKPVWSTRVIKGASRAGNIGFRPRAGVVLVTGASHYGWTTAALDLESGRKRWMKSDSVQTADDFDTGDFGGNYALIYKQLDSYADTGRLMRIDPRKGVAMWTVALGKAYGTTVYNVRNHVVVSRRGRDGDGTVLFLDGVTGKRVAEVHGEVRAEDGNIVVVASGTGVVAYDQNGTKRWEAAGTVVEAGRGGFSDGKTVYLLTGSKKEGMLSLVTLDARSGKRLASLTDQTEAELLGTVNGFLIAESPYGSDGLIFAAKPHRS